MSERIFVDSSAYYALTDVRDQNHAAAVITVWRLAREGNELHTSNFVLAETHGLILNRLNRDIAERVLDETCAGATKIIRLLERDETQAREIIHQNKDKEYSLVDASSFALMQRLHIRVAWTYDQHFEQFGFRRIM